VCVCETLVRVYVSLFLLRVIKIAEKKLLMHFLNSGKAWDGKQLITFRDDLGLVQRCPTFLTLGSTFLVCRKLLLHPSSNLFYTGE